MTTADARRAPIELVEKRADGGLVRAMPAFAAERVMLAGVEARVVAAKGLRRPLREPNATGAGAATETTPLIFDRSCHCIEQRDFILPFSGVTRCQASQTASTTAS